MRAFLAMLPPVIAFILQWILWSAIQPFVWFLFYPAVFLSAWIGGLLPGLLSTFASAAIVWWFFLPPQFSFSLPTPMALVSIGVFCVMGVLFSILLERRNKTTKQADDARRASEQMLIFLELSHTGGWDLDLIDHSANRTLEHDRIFGYESLLPQWTYEMFLEHVLPEDRIEVDRLFNEAITAQANWNFRCRIRRADGEVRWILAAGGHLRNKEGTVQRMAGIVQDITEHKQAELEILTLNKELEQRVADRTAELQRAKSVAEKANHTKDSFLATMSHEIRTPLTGMLGMLEVLSLTPLNREQEEILKATWDSSRSLLRIVNDILDWSKIEEGKLALAPQSTSIPQLLQDVINTYSRVASAKSLVLWQHADIRLSSAHIVDALRLSQVLNNFVSNAIKFTQRGEIELRAELLDQLDSGERIRFSVRDTGIGMAKDVQEHVFQRYRQESADTARMYGGTGLGLAICRRLAEFMDGIIELESELGQGSTFSITLILPVSGAPGEAVQSLNPEVEQRAVEPLFDGSVDAPLVLAVDDHPINRDLLARQIKLLGLRAETAENGQVALSMWRDGRFALVITDCHMPEMDGYELAKKIRKIEAEESRTHTPIIAWTANALAEEAGRCHASGMDELLVKPANLSQLKKTLAKWLNIPETNNSQPTPSLHDVDDRQATGPIDYVELSKVVPDSAEHIQVLHDFQQHIRADRAKLIEMLEQGDQVNVERTAHRMKGSCRMVGATDMASACATIERTSREKKLNGARAGMTGLDDAIKRFEAHFAELTDSTGGNR